MKRFRIWLVAALIVMAGVIAVLTVSFTPGEPRIDFEMVSPPQPGSTEAVFYISSPGSADTVETTQACYRAEFLIRNLGPGSIIFPYRGAFSLEVQPTNSSGWQSADQVKFGTWPPLKRGSHQLFTVRIPREAAQWRITTSYQPWHLPSRFLNSVCRDVLGVNEVFGNQKIYDAVSQPWKIIQATDE